MINELHVWHKDREPGKLNLVDCECTASKRQYQEMSITPIAIDMKQNLLAGSVTQEIIEIEEITVRDFEDDTAFPTEGFDVKFN